MIFQPSSPISLNGILQIKMRANVEFQKTSVCLNKCEDTPTHAELSPNTTTNKRAGSQKTTFNFSEMPSLQYYHNIFSVFVLA